MKKISTYLAFLGFCIGTGAACHAPKASGPAVRHVVLISIDGSRPAFYTDTAAWHAPVLHRLMEKGVYAADGIQSVFPSLTAPSHATLITGAYPARHGIYYNNPPGKQDPHAYWYDSAIQVKTLWDAVKEKGLTAAAIRWPITLGAPVRYNAPVKYAKTVDGHLQFSHQQPQSLMADFEKARGRALTRADLGHKNGAVQKTLGQLANYIISTYRPNLVALHLGVDHREHVHGKNAPEVKEGLQVVDSVIGSIVATLKHSGLWDSTALIITGDHGHENTRAIFQPNVYLAQHGWLKDGQARFHGAGGSAFLYLKDRKDTTLVDRIKKVLSQSPEGQQQLFRFIDRPELDRMGAAPQPVLALAMKPGYLARSGVKGKALKTDVGGSAHGYDPTYPTMHTTFIAVGTGIGPHQNIAGMGIKDIAPLVAQLLQLDLNAPDGKLMPGILAATKQGSVPE